MDKLLGNIEVFKTYIDDIIVLGKYFFKKHIENLRMVFGRLCAAGLKVNAPKCSFGVK